MPKKNLIEENKRKEDLRKIIISNHMQLSDGKKTELLDVFVLQDATEQELKKINIYQRFLIIEDNKKEPEGRVKK